jgi:hypothetical protein
MRAYLIFENDFHQITSYMIMIIQQHGRLLKIPDNAKKLLIKADTQSKSVAGTVEFWETLIDIPKKKVKKCYWHVDHLWFSKDRFSEKEINILFPDMPCQKVESTEIEVEE